jgi:phenylacetic acid degradation operon negative regulatory protein
MLMNVSAKAVVLEVLSAGESIYKGTLPVRSLVQAASVFDIAENSVRVAIVRLRAEGLLESPGRGEYRLGPSAQVVNDKIHGWRTVSSRVGAWDGAWAAVFTADLSRTDRPALRRRLRALRFLGFEELKPGLFLRPNNLTPGIDGIRDELVALGLDADASVFRMQELNPEQEQRARAMWDSPRLEQTYSKLHGDLTISMDRLEELPLNDSVREAFLLGREGIRHVVLDPLLPEPLVDEDKRSSMVGILQDYCDKGLNLWARFLQVD